MVNLLELFVKIGADTSEAINGINETTDTAEKSSGKLEKVAQGFGKFASAVGKGIGLVLGASVTGIVALTKQSVNMYSEYEQLVGGVEKLFGDSSAQLMEYSKNAYRTAGLSANEYMESVTSFSASLISSLGGDTDKAVEVANMALTDMSDNANVFGTSMESVQNAYQGFAKQNYTMLDNLKLGYGGTKEEMERLLADAEAISGVKYDISNLNDVYEAIHVIQTELNITGTTQKEAEKTIQGSMGMLKGAWANFLTGLGDESQDLGQLIDDVIDSALSTFENILPVAQQTLVGIGTAFRSLAPIISDQLPSLISDLLPVLIDSVIILFNGVVDALPILLNLIMSQLPPLLSAVGNALMVLLPMLTNTAVELLLMIMNFLSANASTVIVPAITQIITMLVRTLTNPAFLIQFINAGLLLIVSLVQGLSQASPQLFALIPELIANLIVTLQAVFPQLMSSVGELLESLGMLVLGAIGGLMGMSLEEVQMAWENFKEAVSTGIQLIGSIISAGIDIILIPFRFIWENCKDAVTSIWNSISSWFTTKLNAILNVVKTVFNNVKTTITSVFNSVKTTIQPIINSISTFISTTFNSIKNTVSIVWEGIKTAMLSPMEMAKKLIKGIVDTIKGFFTGMNISFPHIKLPHFSVRPSGWKIEDLLEGTIPTLGISWYAKAMDKPFMFTKPTIVGDRGFGEAGDEFVYGRENLMRDIAEASQPDTTVIQDKMNDILKKLDELSKMKMVTETGALVGQLAPKMDSALGNITEYKGRGLATQW